MYNRRKFIHLGSSFAAAMALGAIGCRSSSKTAGTGNNNNDAGRLDMRRVFGIQLYTLRDDMPKDPRGVLTKLSGYGYRQIESYEGPLGMFWGLGYKEFKTVLDNLSLTIVASHCDYKKDLNRKAAEAAETGMQYLICPWLGPQKTLDDFRRYADEFNAAGEVCKKAGIRFAYHNHDYTFVNMEGQIPQDLLMERTDPALVDFEMDYYWVVTAGHSPEAWLKKYPNRFRLCHIKDRKKDAPATEKSASCNLGEGMIDYTPIFKTAKENGMQYQIVEQERYDGTTPLGCAEANAKYMNKMLLAGRS
jgi:sugar phosphate isomerase/epimerase